MKIIYLNGRYLLRSSKVGVENYNYNLIEKAIMEYDSKTLRIGLFNFGKNIIKDDVIKKSIFSNRITESKYIPSKLKHILPVEIIFGKHDIYISDGWTPILLKKSVRIGIVHDLMSVIFPENYDKKSKFILRKYFKTLKKLDAIITVSENTKKDIIDIYSINPEKIHVVYPGLNIEEFKNKSMSSNYRNRSDKKYIFFIGDMRKNKNLIFAIKGFKKYLETNKGDLEFYIAGNKKFEYENLKRYVYNNNLQEKVKFLGYITEDEKINYIKNAFAFILPSYYEGFGIPLIEAMALETPVVAVNKSSMKEICDGYSLLISDDNPDNLRIALEKLKIEKIKNEIIKKQKTRVKDFDIEKSYKKFRKVIKLFE